MHHGTRQFGRWVAAAFAFALVVGCSSSTTRPDAAAPTVGPGDPTTAPGSTGASPPSVGSPGPTPSGSAGEPASDGGTTGDGDGGGGSTSTGTSRSTDGTTGGTSATDGTAGADGGATTDGTTSPRGPLKIGVLHGSGNPAGVIGADNVNPSDERRARWIRAMEELVNETGGFGGHPIEVVIRTVDVTDPGRNTQQRLQAEACVALTEDEEVFMVLAWEGARWAADCYVEHGTPVLAASGMGNAEDIRSRLPWIIPNLWLNDTRMARLLPTGLCEVDGWVNDRIGIFAYDDPGTKQAVETQMVPAFERCGGTVADTFYARPNVGDVGGDVASAILRFKSQDIDRVAFLASGGGAMILFLNQAESQDYRPWYGISSYDRPAVWAGQTPPEQRRNLYGVGFHTAIDVGAQAQPPIRDREKQCWDTLNERANEDFSHSRGNPAVDASPVLALVACELFWSTQHASAAATRPLERDGIWPLFAQVGTSYPAVMFTGVRWNAASSDGIADWAPLRWDTDGCDCLVYSGAFRPIPFD